jgi:release factor glutamine methyltransferase
METWTVRSLLAWSREWLAKKGVEAPRLDAELLLASALKCDRTRLYIDFDKPMGADELAQFKALIQRRARREPVAMILGTREFYGRPFAVGPGVFIPRPETELLVQLALEARPLRVLDLCAGSGAVGLSIAAERPEASVDLVELSPAAAEYTARNAASLVPGRARVLIGDLFAALPERTRYDAVVTNPPYVPRGHAPRLAPEILEHEPHQALFADDEGLAVIARIVGAARDWLAPGGFFGTEIDPPQAERVLELCARAGLEGARSVKDLAGLDRHVVAKNPPAAQLLQRESGGAG